MEKLTENQQKRIQELRSYLTKTEDVQYPNTTEIKVTHDFFVNVRAWLILISEDE